MDRFCGSGTSSFVTSHGPSGPKVGQPLPLVQVPPRSSWYSRSDTSLQTQNPATKSKASLAPTYEARSPITIASSTSQSVFFEPRGITTLSFGPTMHDGALLK